MRVLICGDRNWTDLESIRCHVNALPEGTVVIEGDCRGADRMAGIAARERGLTVEVYPADWNQYGKRAGYLRNTQMLVEGKPDLVLAFHHDILQSKGTAMMVKIAQTAGVQTVVYNK
jgi:hypothetical protein